MGRVIITTCGTSLLESSCWLEKDKNGKIITPPLISSASDRIERERRKSEWRNWIIAQTNNYQNGYMLIQNFNKDCWNNLNMLIDLPAELASLRAIMLYFGTGNNCLKKDDKVFLLHSDDAEAKFCAETISEIIKTQLSLPIKPEPLEINNLDPKNSDDFTGALREMKDKVNQIANNDFNNLFLNLTGGYKALAIELAAFAQEKQTPTIFYLFEETNYDQIYVQNYNSTANQRVTQAHSVTIGGP